LSRPLLTLIARLRELDPARLARTDDGRRAELNTLLVETHRELGGLALSITDLHFVQVGPLQSLEPFAISGQR
jgi:hypothetical protein